MEPFKGRGRGGRGRGGCIINQVPNALSANPLMPQHIRQLLLSWTNFGPKGIRTEGLSSPVFVLCSTPLHLLHLRR